MKEPIQPRLVWWTQEALRESDEWNQFFNATSALHHFRYLLWPSAVRPQAASPGITPEFDLFWTPGDTLGFLLTFLHEENLTQFPRTVSSSVRRVETPHDWLNLCLRVVFFYTFNSKSISYSCITCWSFIKVHSVKFNSDAEVGTHGKMKRKASLLLYLTQQLFKYRYVKPQRLILCLLRLERNSNKDKSSCHEVISNLHSGAVHREQPAAQHLQDQTADGWFK